LGVAAATVAVVVAVAFGVRTWLQPGEDGTASPQRPTEARVEVLGAAPGAGAHGLPQHPPLRLIHPGGAVVAVPPGEMMFGEFLDLQQLPTPTSSRWRFEGPAWRFVSATGMVHEEPVEVRLPARGADETARIVVLSPAGAWVPLVTQREGDQLVAQVTGVAAPWVVAVGMPAERPGASAGDSTILELEGLYYSNREEWQARALSWLEANPPPADEELLELRPAQTGGTSEGDPGARASWGTSTRWDAGAAPKPTSFGAFQGELRSALLRLRCVGARARRDGQSPTPGGMVGGAAYEQYRAAVLQLRRLQDTWLTYQEQWADDYAFGDVAALEFDDTGEPIAAVLESAFRTYTPGAFSSWRQCSSRASSSRSTSRWSTGNRSSVKRDSRKGGSRKSARP